VKLRVALDARGGDVAELRQAAGRLDRPAADLDRVESGIAVHQA
jgi:hypothetical protein